jgi:hypothetical protein
VISQMDHRYATEVYDIMTSAPEWDPYTTLRTKLMMPLYPSKEQPIRQLLTLKETGDRKPSQLLRHLKSLAPNVPDDFLRSIWSDRLPPNVRLILAGQPEGDMDATTRSADRIAEAAPSPALPSVVPFPDNTALSSLSMSSSASTQRRAGPTLAAVHEPPPGQQISLQMTLHPPSACTITATEPGRKSVHSPATTASRETHAADISGDTCLRYNHSPPLHHGQVQQTAVPGIYGFGPLRVPPEVHSAKQRTCQLWPLCG